MAALAARITRVSLAAMLRPTSMAASINSSRGTTRYTDPKCSNCSAVTFCAV